MGRGLGVGVGLTSLSGPPSGAPVSNKENEHLVLKRKVVQLEKARADMAAKAAAEVRVVQLQLQAVTRQAQAAAKSYSEQLQVGTLRASLLSLPAHQPAGLLLTTRVRGCMAHCPPAPPPGHHDALLGLTACGGCRLSTFWEARAARIITWHYGIIITQS